MTAQLAADIRAGDALLKDELDRSMRKFRTTNPAFFNEYTSARTIVDLGSSGTPPTPPTPPVTPP